MIGFLLGIAKLFSLPAWTDPASGIASWHAGAGSYQCPFCSCGAVPDWEGRAELRCTGCKAPLEAAEGGLA